MSIYSIILDGTGNVFEVDTSEEVVSSPIFDELDAFQGYTSGADLVDIEGAADALVSGNLLLAQDYLNGIGMTLNASADNVYDGLGDLIEARAEANANLAGRDPSDPTVWAEVHAEAMSQWNDPDTRRGAYYV